MGEGNFLNVAPEGAAGRYTMRWHMAVSAPGPARLPPHPAAA